MPCTRSFCDEAGNEHALVPPIVEVRDNLGVLSVQVLAAKYDLSTLPYDAMLREFHNIVCDLHQTYDQERTRLPS